MEDKDLNPFAKFDPYYGTPYISPDFQPIYDLYQYKWYHRPKARTWLLCLDEYGYDRIKHLFEKVHENTEKDHPFYMMSKEVYVFKEKNKLQIWRLYLYKERGFSKYNWPWRIWGYIEETDHTFGLRRHHRVYKSQNCRAAKAIYNKLIQEYLL